MQAGKIETNRPPRDKAALKSALEMVMDRSFGDNLSDTTWKTAEITFTGNELLKGNVLNTNSQWMAKTLTSLGIEVKRMNVIEDDIEVIAEALGESLRREPDFIFISGGLGPTYDDLTLEGVAKALGRPLQVNSAAMKMIRSRYIQAEKAGLLKVKESEKHMAKMADLPAGALPLANPVGAAPGVLIEYGKTMVISLPGVPVEMKAIFSYSIIPRIKPLLGNAFHAERAILVTGLAESRLAPIILDAMARIPATWMKSCVQGSGRTEICISTTATNEGEANRRVEEAYEMIIEKVKEIGGSIKDQNEKS
jgi:molybdenum cofactor synthesis domain-containing protein